MQTNNTKSSKTLNSNADVIAIVKGRIVECALCEPMANNKIDKYYKHYTKYSPVKRDYPYREVVIKEPVLVGFEAGEQTKLANDYRNLFKSVLLNNKYEALFAKNSLYSPEVRYTDINTGDIIEFKRGCESIPTTLPWDIRGREAVLKMVVYQEDNNLVSSHVDSIEVGMSPPELSLCEKASKRKEVI